MSLSFLSFFFISSFFASLLPPFLPSMMTERGKSPEILEEFFAVNTRILHKQEQNTELIHRKEERGEWREGRRGREERKKWETIDQLQRKKLQTVVRKSVVRIIAGLGTTGLMATFCTKLYIG